MPTGIYKRSKAHKKKISKRLKGNTYALGKRWKVKDVSKYKGNKNSYKGDKAGKAAIHRWVEKKKGKPSECKHCGTTKSGRFEWANVDHKYKRKLDDYIRLCTACHNDYDYKTFGLRKDFDLYKNRI